METTTPQRWRRRRADRGPRPAGPADARVPGHDLALRRPGADGDVRTHAEWSTDGPGGVAGRLGELPEPWQVLHAVPVGPDGAELDHLVIGPAGVFALSVRHHPGASVAVYNSLVYVDGTERTYGLHSRAAAARVGDRLSRACGGRIWVHGLVAVVGRDRRFEVRRQAGGASVHVLDGDDLVPWLTGRPGRYRDDEVAAIFDRARWAPVWTD